MSKPSKDKKSTNAEMLRIGRLVTKSKNREESETYISISYKHFLTLCLCTILLTILIQDPTRAESILSFADKTIDRLWDLRPTISFDK